MGRRFGVGDCAVSDAAAVVGVAAVADAVVVHVAELDGMVASCGDDSKLVLMLRRKLTCVCLRLVRACSKPVQAAASAGAAVMRVGRWAKARARRARRQARLSRRLLRLGRKLQRRTSQATTEPWEPDIDYTFELSPRPHSPCTPRPFRSKRVSSTSTLKFMGA